MAKVSKRSWTYKGETKTAYVVRYFDKEGKRRQETFDKFKAADAFRKKVEGELDAGTHVARADTFTVEDAGKRFIADLERRQRIGEAMTLTTIAYRRNQQRHIDAAFGKVKLIDLTRLRIQGWVNAQAETFSYRSVKANRDHFHLLLSFCLAQEWIGKNVMADHAVKLPSMAKTRAPIPSIAELQRLIAALDIREPKESRQTHRNRRVMVGLALFCGMRWGEVTGLQWENVDLVRGRVSVRHSLSLLDGLKSPKTFAGIRDNPLPKNLLADLQEIHRLRGFPEKGHVILSRRSLPMNHSDSHRMMRPLFERAGLIGEDGHPLYTFHKFRHAAGSLLIHGGVNPLHVKQFMGHASIKTTMDIYGHLFPEDTGIASAISGAETLIDKGARMEQRLIDH